MPNWNSSPHPISDIRDWATLGRLELRPDFQRREVWSEAAKIMLIDTILKNVPMPKILVNSILRDGVTYRVVIDGQQRLAAIIGFLRDKFALASPCAVPYQGLKFSGLPSQVQSEILRYKLDLNEISEANESELREIYSRVNKYNVSLNRQELRKADYPGSFLNLSEKIAQSEYFERAKVFTVASIRRYGDVEFTSELIAALLNGPQDKKLSLDAFYERLMVWDNADQDRIVKLFDDVFRDLDSIFNENFPIHGTRFRQRADFYSLFLAIAELRTEGFGLEGKDLDLLRKDLEIIDYNAKPSSEYKFFSEYGIRCSTDANSEPSRKWRIQYLKSFLSGTYVGVPTQGVRHKWGSLLIEMSSSILGCPPAWQLDTCGQCKEDLDGDDEPIPVWRRSSSIFQFSNVNWIHPHCFKAVADQWISLGTEEAQGGNLS